MIASLSLISVSPLARVRARCPRICSVLPLVIRLATVTTLRSLGESSLRSQTSEKSTLSVRTTSILENRMFPDPGSE